MVGQEVICACKILAYTFGYKLCMHVLRLGMALESDLRVTTLVFVACTKIVFMENRNARTYCSGIIWRRKYGTLFNFGCKSVCRLAHWHFAVHNSTILCLTTL